MLMNSFVCKIGLLLFVYLFKINFIVFLIFGNWWLVGVFYFLYLFLFVKYYIEDIKILIDVIDILLLFLYLFYIYYFYVY